MMVASITCEEGALTPPPSLTLSQSCVSITLHLFTVSIAVPCPHPRPPPPCHSSNKYVVNLHVGFSSILVSAVYTC